GSVIGTIQFHGSGPVRSVWLPAGTLQARGQAICASIKGMAFDPCFNVDRTGEGSFRGSLSGLGMIAVCVSRRRLVAAGMGLRRHEPVSSATSVAGAE